jgi:hypothetical protein
MRLALVGTALLAGSVRAEEPRAYKTLRHAETWNFLEASSDKGTDPFDVVKNCNLGGPWRLTFGGSTRLRYEADENGWLQTDPETDNDLGRLRSSLHLGISRGGMFRWFSEVSHADTMGSERWASGIEENDVDVQNFFFDFTAVPSTPHSVTFRVGRQELSFGNERLIGVNDFANVRTTFDGMQIIARTKRTETSLFGLWPVEHVEEHDLDEPSNEETLYGIHSTFRPAANHELQGYFYVLQDDSDTHVSEKTSRAGEERRDTIGVRYVWTRGGWMVETEWAAQRGHWSDDDIQSGFGTVNGSYQWRNAGWLPRLSFGVETATGDSDALDGRRGTFDPLFGSTRTGLGHLGVTGRRNLECVRIAIETKPMRGLRWDSAILASRLEESEDALYDQYGVPLRKDPTGSAGSDVGWEAHSQVSYQFHAHHEISLEIAQFWGGDVVRSFGTETDATWGWVGYEFKF